ncbi:ATP-binding protein, partial [Pseudomonas aeruginosa]
DAGSITLTLDENGVSVEDTGAGVPEELRERFFMPFVRGSFSSGRGEGLGLGLSLVKLICAAEGRSVTPSAVETHGCRLEVLL